MPHAQDCVPIAHTGLPEIVTSLKYVAAAGSGLARATVLTSFQEEPFQCITAALSPSAPAAQTFLEDAAAIDVALAGSVTVAHFLPFQCFAVRPPTPHTSVALIASASLARKP